MRVKIKSNRKCYLCGKKGADTKEHIPPRGIFPKIPEGKLITVPAHKECNSIFCKDDELFRNFIITGSYRTPKGRKAWDEQVVKSFGKNPGAKKDLAKRLGLIWIKLKSGAYIREEAMRQEESLYKRQITRITKGLFYYEFQEPLPTEIPIEVEMLAPPEISLPWWNEVFAESGFRPKWVHVVPGIFSYFYGAAKENKHEGIASMVFYDTIVWKSLVG